MALSNDRLNSSIASIQVMNNHCAHHTYQPKAKHIAVKIKEPLKKRIMYNIKRVKSLFYMG
jgi:hypothetical protein